MTILVTGANGQLGMEMRMVSRNSAHRYIFADITAVPGDDTLYLDITDQEAVCSMVDRYAVDAIVNCAAYTNVDKAEEDVALCRALNVDGPAILAGSMKKVGGFLVHVSTDYVFGETADNELVRTPLVEEEECNPQNVYGKTKLEGELAIKESGCRYMIIRTAWLYSEFGKNFVKTMLALTSARSQLNVVSDQIGTPTYALDLAEAIYDILENGKTEGNEGIYHYSNEGACSWYDFAKTIAAYAGNTGCEIRPCTSEEYPSLVKRPAYSVLDKTKIKNTFGLSVPQWIDSLKKCLKNLI